jgi:hypothetical protein
MDMAGTTANTRISDEFEAATRVKRRRRRTEDEGSRDTVAKD